MSQFYREQKEIIFNLYKQSKKKNRILQYFFLFLVIATLMNSAINIIKLANFFDPILFINLFFVIFFMVIYKWLKAKYDRSRKESIIEYSLTDISDDNLKMLIKEIDDNIDNVNNLGKWISGSFITMLVLILTLTSNIILKFFDFIISNNLGSDKKKLVSELRNLNIESLSQEIILQLSSILFVTILIGYFSVISFTRNKRDISSFLKDVIYERQKNKKA